MSLVQNPVLPGFNPDPSMICVGRDFYIATSTFEWFPGVRIYHSTDLVSWEPKACPLDRVSQLDLKGVASSGGVWAPDLSYSDGRFYLIYTVVHNFGKPFYDVHNYLVTAGSIDGPWSEPVFLNSSGFDPSLFHDDDGRKWLVNMFFDYRTWRVRFGGISLQEYSEERGALIGEAKVIFGGTPAGTTEGPHVYKKDGFYYLLCAEGGTSYRHQAIMARSRTLEGPYELSPLNPLVSSYPYPLNPLQKAGHASMAPGPDGNWYLAHLCSRPVGPNRYCILGRETAVQAVSWIDGWPALAGGSGEPKPSWESPLSSGASPVGKERWKDDFDGISWDGRFQSLRVPLGSRASLSDRKGWLRLYGKETLGSNFEQSLLACRQQHFRVRAETKLAFSPASFQQTAGLAYYYDGTGYYYACVTRDERLGRVVSMMCRRAQVFEQPVGAGLPIPDGTDVVLRLEISVGTARFSFSVDEGKSFASVGPELDATVLSDDFYEQNGMGNRFTGAFIGICCQDISGNGLAADFDYFGYAEL